MFDWDGGGIDHVGLVTSANSSTVYTIEGNTDGGHTRAHSRPRSSSDIVGYSEPVGATDRPSGRVSIYGVLSDGSLTYTALDAATGKRTHGAVHGAPLPFTPKALATLDFNTVLITDTTGKLYRINVISHRGETLRPQSAGPARHRLDATTCWLLTAPTCTASPTAPCAATPSTPPTPSPQPASPTTPSSARASP